MVLRVRRIGVEAGGRALRDSRPGVAGWAAMGPPVVVAVDAAEPLAHVGVTEQARGRVRRHDLKGSAHAATPRFPSEFSPDNVGADSGSSFLRISAPVSTRETESQNPKRGATAVARRIIRNEEGPEWTRWDLNPGPLPCEGSDLPLIYEPADHSTARIALEASVCWPGTPRCAIPDPPGECPHSSGGLASSSASNCATAPTTASASSPSTSNASRLS